ncbi:MAG: hypothetical protein GY749_47090 [Desulfobacteraceae bacterium]|nr:hypothetical protein [Desulfobacteraceae bacterium]
MLKKSLISLSPIIAIYCMWSVITLSVFVLGLFLAGIDSLLKFTIPVSIAFFIMLASLSTAIFMVYAEPELQKKPVLRYISILLTVFLGIGLFIFIRQTGNKSIVLFVIVSANLMVFANLIGAWIITPLEQPSELVLLCAVMSLSDIFSVFSGPTRFIAQSVDQYYKGGMKGDVPIGDFLLIKIAVPGLDELMPVFGIADWIIIAFLASAVVKFEMNDNLVGRSLDTMVKEKRLSVYLPAASAGLFAAVFSAQYFNIFLPALPVVSLFFLTYILAKYPVARNLNRKDWILLFSFSGCMIGIFALICYRT